jgi:hypothetical protein
MSLRDHLDKKTYVVERTMIVNDPEKTRAAEAASALPASGWASEGPRYTLVYAPLGSRPSENQDIQNADKESVQFILFMHKSC